MTAEIEANEVNVDAIRARSKAANAALKGRGYKVTVDPETPPEVQVLLKYATVDVPALLVALEEAETRADRLQRQNDVQAGRINHFRAVGLAEHARAESAERERDEAKERLDLLLDTYSASTLGAGLAVPMRVEHLLRGLRDLRAFLASLGDQEPFLGRLSEGEQTNGE